MSLKSRSYFKIEQIVMPLGPTMNKNQPGLLNDIPWLGHIKLSEGIKKLDIFELLFKSREVY